MIKRTFADVKKELARVTGQAGLQVNDARVQEMVDLAQERLSTMGEWPFQYARVKFCQQGGILALPTEFEAIVHTALGSEPIEVQPRWYEFLEYGPGVIPPSKFSNLALDHGESPVVRQPADRGAKLRVVSTADGDTGNVIVRGYDINGLFREETFALPDATSTTMWRKIAQVTKPVTAGDVVLSYTDMFGRVFQAAAYRRRDTTPSFRTYRFTGVGEGEQTVVTAIVRRRLQKIVDDQDELFVTNLGALRLGVKGISLEDKGDVVGAAAAFASARQILLDEANLYKAGRNTQPVNVTRVSGLSVRPDIF